MCRQSHFNILCQLDSKRKIISNPLWMQRQSVTNLMLIREVIPVFFFICLAALTPGVNPTTVTALVKGDSWGIGDQAEVKAAEPR